MLNLQVHKQLGKLTVRIYQVTDMFADKSPLSSDAYLVVPTNPYLVQCRKSYVTRGDKIPYVPAEMDRSEASSRWGGLEIDKEHQLYPVECIDGRVQATAGNELTTFLKRLPIVDQYTKIKCLPGSSIQSPSFGLVAAKSLIHTAIPYRQDKDAVATLSACYVDSVRMVATSDQPIEEKSPRIVTVVLGSGSRGFKTSECVDAAHLACKTISNSGFDVCLDFAIRDKDLLERFCKMVHLTH